MSARVHQRGDRGPVVVLVPGFIQNHRAFEVNERSFPSALAAAGYRAWTVELSADGAPDLEDYAREVAAVIGDAGEEVALIGHSMGGLVSLATDNSTKARLNCMVTLGAPLLPGLPRAPLTNAIGARAARLMAKAERPFRGSMIAKTMKTGQRAFDHPLAQHPFRIWHTRAMREDVLEDALDESFRDDSWAAFADMLELSASGGERAGRVNMGARLRELDLPLLVVGADRDGLAPQRSTRPVFARAKSADKRYVLMGQKKTGAHFGHIDLLVGDRAADFVYPEVIAFLDRFF